MRYVQINVNAISWADSIIFAKHRELLAAGHESWVFWGRGKHEQDDRMHRFVTEAEVYCDALLTRLDGRAGFHSKAATRRLLRRLDAIDPDVVHLHCLTGYYINVEMLFEWLAAHRCQVIWTLHDCWAFTGHCIYFTYVGCPQWRSGCAAGAPCPQKREYPEMWVACDAAVRRCFEDKRRLFTLLPVNRMRLVTPSRWLAGLVSRSFLGKYDVEVRHNTVNTGVFKPTPSDFRVRSGVGGRFMVLGVANKWSERKGLGSFARLARELDPESYAVVVVGLASKQIKRIRMQAPRIIALPQTSSADELAQIYTAADILFNPTLEENYPTVNLEAQACGTPVVTFDTGGCGETLSLNGSRVIPRGDMDRALSVIREMNSRSADGLL